MKKAIKVILSIVLLVLAVLLIAGIVIHEPRPKGKSGPGAEALADSMLHALNHEAYQQLNEISWTYPRGHHFVWNKRNHQVTVHWDSYKVDLNTQTLEGVASRNEEVLKGEPKEEAITQAWKYFANDSFWLIAPYKIRDPGTERAVVETKDGPALLVTYTSGGVTPGDSYLWHLDDNYMPVAWQMWVKIIPVGGIKFSWEEWKNLKGAKIATTHSGPGPVEIKITNLQSD